MTLISEARTKEEAQRIYDELCNRTAKMAKGIIKTTWEEYWAITGELEKELARKLEELKKP